eukprot:3940712-Rhodomonas_salina.3
MMTYKTKYDKLSGVSQHKRRLVARGDLQNSSEYNETYLPTAKFTAIQSQDVSGSETTSAETDASRRPLLSENDSDGQTPQSGGDRSRGPGELGDSASESGALSRDLITPYQ